MTIRNLISPKITISIKLISHPADENARGIAKAPVPTIKLKTYSIPTWTWKSHDFFLRMMILIL